MTTNGGRLSLLAVLAATGLLLAIGCRSAAGNRAPALLGAAPVPSGNFGRFPIISGTDVYYNANYGFLRGFDVSDPRHPIPNDTNVDSIILCGDACDAVFLHGNLGFVFSGTSVAADPLNATHASWIQHLPGQPSEYAWKFGALPNGNIVVLRLGPPDEILILSLSATSAGIVSETPFTTERDWLALDGERSFLAQDTSTNIEAYDLSTSSSPVRIGSVTVSVPSGESIGGYAVSGTNMFVSTFTSGAHGYRPSNITWYRIDPGFTQATKIAGRDDFNVYGYPQFVDGTVLFQGADEDIRGGFFAMTLGTDQQIHVVSRNYVSGLYAAPDFAVDKTRRLVFLLGGELQILDLDSVLGRK